MVRTLIGVVLGIAGWLVIVIGVSFALRAAAPALAAELNAHTTAVALAERLGISFVGSLIGGVLAARVGSQRAPLLAGAVLLLWWGAYHVMVIWHQFPVWYHLTFFVSLPLLSMLGGRIGTPKRMVFA